MVDRYQAPPEGFQLDQVEEPVRERAPAPSRYTPPPSGFALEPLEPVAPTKPVPQVPAGPLSTGQMFKSAYEHALPSAVKTAQEIVHPFLHPVETYEGLKTIGSGLASKAGIRPDPESEKALSAIKDYYGQRYGGIEAAKRSFAENPLGVASDWATVLTGGGGALKALGKVAEVGSLAKTAGGLGKVGEVVGEAGRFVDPVTAAASLTSMAAEPITKGLTPLALSFKSGKTLTSLRQAEEAGATANPEFWRHYKGEGKPEEVIDAVKVSIDKIKDERRNDYLSSSQGWKSNQTPLDMTPIVGTFLQHKQQFAPTGTTPVYMAPAMQDIGNTINHWSKSGRTMADFDFLKRDLDKLYNTPNFMRNPEAQAVLTSVRNETWNSIVNHDPVYADIMKKYEDATKEINAINQEVGSNKAAATTRLKKLIAASDKGTIDRLLKENPNLPYMLAGQELSPIMPEGLRGAIMSSLAYSIPAMAVHPGAILGALGASPKIAGGLQYGLGAARTLPMQAERMTVPSSLRRATMAAERPFMEDERPVRATGGRIGMTAERLLSMLEGAKKSVQKDTESLLQEPDEKIAKALTIAKEGI